MKSILSKFCFLVLSLILIVSCKETANDSGTKQANVSAKTEFDVVILNGRVIDPETNFDAVQNVGIKNGEIAIVTEDEIKGKETIDATNQVVSPGFIDIHAHGQNIGDY